MRSARFGWLTTIIRWLIPTMVLLGNWPLDAEAQSNEYRSPNYGFTVDWTGEWRENTSNGARANSLFDVLELTWDSSISVSYVGFLSDSTEVDAIGLDYLAAFVSNDGTGRQVESARIDSDGTLYPTIVQFVNGSTIQFWLLIYPHSLPIDGTAFVEVWRLLPSMEYDDLDEAYENVTFDLPESTSEQGSFPSSSGASNQSSLNGDCIGYDHWREQIVSIHDRMLDAVRSFSIDARLPGMFGQAGLNIAQRTIGALQSELLLLDDPWFSSAATTSLSSALSSLSLALMNLDRRAGGDTAISIAVIESYFRSAQMSSTDFVNEIAMLDASC